MFTKIVSLFIVLALCISCASLPIKPISNEDLPDLKGKWEGFRNTSGAEHHTHLSTTLEIKNDNVPIQASIYFHQTTRGTIEYPVILYIRDGKLVSKKYNLTLILYKEGNKFQLKGQMDLPKNYHEELVFWKK